MKAVNKELISTLEGNYQSELTTSQEQKCFLETVHDLNVMDFDKEKLVPYLVLHLHCMCS